MRAQALLALGAYAALGNADEIEAVSAAPFTPTTLNAPFLEQFENDSRWKASHAKKEDTADEEWQYVGTWANEEPTVFPGIPGDKGLVLKDKAAHHAISAAFDKPISNKDNTLVVQYEVKLQTGLECGGAYMKLLQDNSNLVSDEFSNASPYVIMFGPDKCGSTNKVHFIFRHKNPKTGEYEEKHMNAAPAARLSKTTALYTLIVNPDQTFEILIDGESTKTGSLLEDFTPAVNPEKEIDDPNDSKPYDWIDEIQIDDPSAIKPEDWDEEAPYEIVDDEAEKPDDWLEDEPRMIDDPEAEKPEDWDDEEDGDWVPPKVANPKCDTVSGCGPWTKPMKKNPEYKGKWRAPRIENPAYKGQWAPQKIANPDFFEDHKPADFEPMGAIGFELWTMQDDILFDNIYIGHSVEDAKKLQAETFDIKVALEKESEEASQPAKKPDFHKQFVDPEEFTKNPADFLTGKFQTFLEIAKRDPIEAIKTVPEIAIGAGVTLVGLLVAIFTFVIGGATAADIPDAAKVQAQKAKDAAAKAKDKVADAVATGADKAKDEVNKRTTRSGN